MSHPRTRTQARAAIGCPLVYPAPRERSDSPAAHLESAWRLRSDVVECLAGGSGGGASSAEMCAHTISAGPQQP